MNNEIEYFDICIVGGSIAGNFLCYLLSNTKLRIAVIEEHKQIGLPFQCAGIISQKVSKLIDFPPEIILNRVSTARIVSSSGDYIKLSGNEKPYVIDRIALDQFFYEKVKEKENITYFLGEKFKFFTYINEDNLKMVIIQTSKRNIKVKILIGCDGPLSTVGKLLGIINKNLYATQIRVRGSFNENEAVLYFDHRWGELFGWIVPEGNHIYRVGIGCSQNIAEKFPIFLKILNIDSNQIIDRQGGLIPSGTMKRLAFDNVLLLGDSACQVKATTGGGIIMLLIAAKYAANCIKKCIKNNKFSRKLIKEYYELPCRIKIGKELKVHYLIRLLLSKFNNYDFKQLFQIINSSKIKNMISIYGDIDFPKTLILKLLINPKLIFLFLKILLINPKIIFKVIKSYAK
ncbi:MAG: hypothetical protein ACFFHD_06875 [Promethearchaeota archaeon]